MNTQWKPRCYALRRLNPFLGVVQVVETPSGRASSSNGLVWDIQILTQAPADWGSLNAGNMGKAWSRYGLWSERDGLAHRPLAAHSKDRQLRRDSEHLIEQVRSNLDRLPYALADRRELWLLDAEQQKPLALLHAMLPDANPPRPEPRYWKACLGQQGVAGQRRFPGTAELESQVKTRAGFNINRAWVTWNPERTTLVDGDSSLIQDDEFPAFGIREDWPEREDRQRVQRYIDWAAPAFLTLPYLDDAQRTRLESSLSDQAVSIEYHWRLYPKILDKNKLIAARVKAGLHGNDTHEPDS
jgi:hypothetical protein